MLWTGIYFLVLLGVACWYLFDYLLSSNGKFKTNYVEPSTAIIDQCLPNEVVEHVLTFLDCQSALNCRSVSKYWKFQASKENVLKEALSNQRAINRQKFSEELAATGIQAKWLTYDDKHSIVDQLRNHMVAASRGALLIELDGKTLEDLRIRHIVIARDWMRKYLVKTIGNYAFDDLQFLIHQQTYVRFGSKKMLEIKPKYKEKFDLIFNLHDFLDRDLSGGHESVDLLWYKPHSSLPLIGTQDPKCNSTILILDLAGFLPPSRAAHIVFLNFFVPCLLHDWLNSSWTTKSWIAGFTYIATLIFSSLVIHRGSLPGSRIGAWIFAAFHFLVLPVLSFEYASHYFLFKGAVLGVFGMFILQDVFYNSRLIKKKHFHQVEATLLLLFLLIFDWRLILDKFVDGSMWKVIFVNALCYLGLCWELIWVNYVHAWGYTPDPTFFKVLFNWNSSTVKGVMTLSLIILIAAFYYPVTVI